MPNRLADAASLYLRQHAHQPVDWWLWGAGAFAEARRRDVPVLVSIGYAACHWCHVMAHETFENPAIAELLNRRMIAVKVDREESPDVDAVLMHATQALTGSGGWPNTVVMTPDGVPFFAGTYFPPERRDGLPGLPDVIEALADAWAERRDEVVASAASLRDQLIGLAEVAPSAGRPLGRAALDRLASEFDLINGGFGGAPKFPPPMVLDALLVKGEPSGLDMAQLTIEAMARGGVHDQVGGGFHRYAVDAAWTVPHFEKMLTDNALLLGTVIRCWRRTPDHDQNRRVMFERVVRGIALFLERDLRRSTGAFAAGLDADSCDVHGSVHEGIYYLWSPELLADALGERDAGWARQVFHVHDAGTFERDLSTLQLRGAPDWQRLDRVLATLKAERDQRFPPQLDDLVVAGWNGLAIDALVTAGMVLAERGWIELAEQAADAVWRAHRVGDGLRRTSRDGVPGDAPGAADDYGALALGFARLAGALGEAEWLRRAQWLCGQAIDRFGAADGGFYDAEESPLLFRRPRDVTDNATPSSTSCLIAALRLVGLTAEDRDLLVRADAAAVTTWPIVDAVPRFAGWALTDLLIAEEAGRGLRRAQVVVVADDPMCELARAAWRMAPAGSAIVTARPGVSGFGHLFEGRTMRDGRATAYVCRGETCFAPVTDYSELKTPLWQRL